MIFDIRYFYFIEMECGVVRPRDLVSRYFLLPGLVADLDISVDVQNQKSYVYSISGARLKMNFPLSYVLNSHLCV
jgi:hypothetical protein